MLTSVRGVSVIVLVLAHGVRIVHRVMLVLVHRLVLAIVHRRACAPSRPRNCARACANECERACAPDGAHARAHERAQGRERAGGCAHERARARASAALVLTSVLARRCARANPTARVPLLTTAPPPPHGPPPPRATAVHTPSLPSPRASPRATASPAGRLLGGAFFGGGGVSAVPGGGRVCKAGAGLGHAARGP